jgi:NAD+ diphosphatase
MTGLAYVGNRLDRCANRRGDSGWIAALRQSPSARMVHINGDKTIFADGRLVTAMPSSDGAAVFLGIDEDQAPWFACRSDTEENLRDLRGLALDGSLSPDELGILAQARSLIHWHERRSFCSNCGARNEIADAGHRRHCPNCQADHFPRTDPVIIIVVCHEGRILLGRQASWQPGMYSALAGFVEPGETIEAAARREVFEEAGVRLGEVRYLASQPWPFPANLMIGLTGDALSEAITIDARELEEARWFTFAEARMMADRTHPEGLWATHPVAIAHQLVRAVLQAP